MLVIACLFILWISHLAFKLQHMAYFIVMEGSINNWMIGRIEDFNAINSTIYDSFGG